MIKNYYCSQYNIHRTGSNYTNMVLKGEQVSLSKKTSQETGDSDSGCVVKKYPSKRESRCRYYGKGKEGGGSVESGGVQVLVLVLVHTPSLLIISIISTGIR